MTVALTHQWSPLSPEVARVGRSLGGPPTILAGRLYSAPGRTWPRLRVGVYPGPDGPEVHADVKRRDDPMLGWDAVEVPDELADEVAVILAEAERRLAG